MSETMTRLAYLFTALAEELELARDLTLKVENAVCSVSQYIPGEADIIDDLQHLDRVVQHLAALRDYMNALALDEGAVCSERASSAADLISMNDVRVRLAAVAGMPAGADDAWEEV